MAPRAYWKGFLRLSLVSCPIQLFPATSEREKVSFNQINAETGNRIRYRKVDEHSGEEVEQQNIVKAYQVEKGHYIEISDEELEAVDWYAQRVGTICTARSKCGTASAVLPSFTSTCPRLLRDSASSGFCSTAAWNAPIHEAGLRAA